MEHDITYKYNVGDRLKFKKQYGHTASPILHSLAGCTVVVVERRNYNGPCYRLEGLDSFFQERSFAGLEEVV